MRRTEKGCRCGRTKCLKQYCACFRIDARCTPDCHCTDCRNDGRHEEERMMAVRLIRLNDPQAFKGTDLQLDDVVVKTPRGTEKTVRGCRCRRSKCQKKYCECFGAGLRCSDNCICEDCENGNEPGAQHKPRPAAAPAKGKGKAVPSSSARPPVPPKGSKLSAAQSAKVGLLVASARPGIPQGQATQKARKRNLSVHVPNPNQHAPAGKTLPAGRMAGAPGSAGLDPPLDSAQLRSAQLGSAQLGSARLASDAPLDSARSFGSAGGGHAELAAGLAAGPAAVGRHHRRLVGARATPVAHHAQHVRAGAPLAEHAQHGAPVPDYAEHVKRRRGAVASVPRHVGARPRILRARPRHVWSRGTQHRDAALAQKPDAPPQHLRFFCSQWKPARLSRR